MTNFKIALALSAYLLFSVSAEIVRPCPDNDNDCVGAWLEEHSSCFVSDLPEDQSTLDPYNLETYSFEAPTFNLTEERFNVVIDGLNQTYVKDFFYNTETCKAVLTLFFPYFNVDSDCNFHAHVTGEEGFTFTLHQPVTFTNMTLTTIFNDYNHADLSDSVTFPYIPVVPNFHDGDSLSDAAASDARVAKIVAAWMELPYVGSLEAFRYRGPDLVTQFTNYKLCKYSEPASVV